MHGAFDQIAEEYDAGFVNTATGRMQREIVWIYLERLIGKREKLNILELNCGTGEDAIWLASMGHNVVATDASEKMLDVARSKVNDSGFKHRISFALLDISNPESYPRNTIFDLVFSNFGGFNCISPKSLQEAIPAIAGLLNPNGRLLAVIMSKFCLWESFYFLLKGKFSEAFRRNRTKSLAVMIGNKSVETWYYSTSDIKRVSNDNFRIIKKRPLGIFLPPSYLDDFFKKRPKMLQVLNRIEKMCSNISPAASFADHYIIEMEVKK